MSYSLTPKKAPSLKLIQVIDNGSAKTFIYENPNDKVKLGLIKELLNKIASYLR
jgi:hypothetical protein